MQSLLLLFAAHTLTHILGYGNTDGAPHLMPDQNLHTAAVESVTDAADIVAAD